MTKSKSQLKREKKEEKDKELKRLDQNARAKKKYTLRKQQKIFAKYLPIAKSATQAAIEAGYAKESASVQAVRLIRNDSVNKLIEKNLKQHLNDAGLSDDVIAEKFKELVLYNSEKVIRVVGEGANARQIEEMRDARVVSSTLANIVKFKGASLENTATQVVSDVNQDTAWLAIKSLLKKLTAEQLKQVIESCEVLLNKDLKIIEAS